MFELFAAVGLRLLLLRVIGSLLRGFSETAMVVVSILSSESCFFKFDDVLLLLLDEEGSSLFKIVVRGAGTGGGGDLGEVADSSDDVAFCDGGTPCFPLLALLLFEVGFCFLGEVVLAVGLTDGLLVLSLLLLLFDVIAAS